MLKLDHIGLEVSDMDRAVDFYHHKLGLNLRSRGVHEDVREEYAFLDMGGAPLELIRPLDAAPMTPNIRPSNCPHVAFLTDDMDATLELIRTQGMDVVKGPLEIPGHERWIYVRDPDGNVIEFIQWL